MWPGGGVLPPLLLPLPEVQLMGCPEAPAEAGAEVEDCVQWQIPPFSLSSFLATTWEAFSIPCGPAFVTNLSVVRGGFLKIALLILLFGR